MSVYPRAKSVKSITPVDAGCADRIIDAKEAGLSKAEAVGGCLAGSDDVQGFERLWKDVEAQVQKARAVAPSKYSTAAEYKTAISVAAPLLDSTKWFDGMKAEKGVVTFGDLKAKV